MAAHTNADTVALPGSAARMRRRLEAGLVLALIVIGCQVLWIGVPVGGMWLASQLTDSFGWHQPIVLSLVLPGMLAVALGLAWLNELYLRIKGTGPALGQHWRRARRGPLEPILIASFMVAFASLLFWFFVLAENPPRGVFGH